MFKNGALKAWSLDSHGSTCWSRKQPESPFSAPLTNPSTHRPQGTTLASLPLRLTHVHICVRLRVCPAVFLRHERRHDLLQQLYLYCLLASLLFIIEVLEVGCLERSSVVENVSSICGLARAVSSTWTSWDLQLRRSCERYF